MPGRVHLQQEDKVKNLWRELRNESARLELAVFKTKTASSRELLELGEEIESQFVKVEAIYAKMRKAYYNDELDAIDDDITREEFAALCHCE